MQLPGPVRAVVGLLANAADEAKHLPDRAIELPMLAVSTALQASLRAQQRYARLAARGEQVLSRRPPTDEPPAWATFDDPVSITADLRRGAGVDAGEHGQAAGELLDQLLGPDEDEPMPPVTVLPVRKATAKKPPARKAPARAAAAAPVAPTAATVAAKKVAAKKTPGTRKAPAKRAADAGGKSVSKPRHVAPSRFDAIADD